MSAEAEGRTRAEEYRIEHGLGVQPLGDLVALMEQLERSDVAILRVDAPEAHGLGMSDPKTGRVKIAVACTPHPMRQRSTLAHELAHIVFADHLYPDTEGWGENKPEESRADSFARHLLAPLGGIAAILGPPADVVVDESLVSALVQRYLASPQIVVIQLAEAGYLTGAQKQAWLPTSSPKLAARFGWMDQYRALSAESATPRSPQRLVARATDAYLRNVLPLNAVARLRSDSVANVRAEFETLGLNPQEPDGATSGSQGLAPPGAHAMDLSELDELLNADSAAGEESEEK